MDNRIKILSGWEEHSLRAQTTTNNLISMSPESYKEQNVASKYWEKQQLNFSK